MLLKTCYAEVKKKNKNGDGHMEVMHSKSWDYLY